METLKVDRRTALSGASFYEQYLKPKRPLIVTDFARDWPALKKWTFDFFKDNYGHYTARVHDQGFHQAGRGYMKHSDTMCFKDYLTLIGNHPTQKRFHNFQVMREAPELVQDFILSRIKDLHFFKFALLFFSGAGSRVNLHYDIDCSNVFLMHFATRKEVYLFPPEARARLYHRPYNMQSHVDVLHPDLEAFPAFRSTTAYRAVLYHGETLFIPSLWWHYVYYPQGGYSLAIRATDSLWRSLRGACNSARHFLVDKGMNKLRGDKWQCWKVRQARRKAERAMEKISLQP